MERKHFLTLPNAETPSHVNPFHITSTLHITIQLSLNIPIPRTFPFPCFPIPPYKTPTSPFSLLNSQLQIFSSESLSLSLSRFPPIFFQWATTYLAHLQIQPARTPPEPQKLFSQTAKSANSTNQPKPQSSCLTIQIPSS